MKRIILSLTLCFGIGLSALAQTTYNCYVRDPNSAPRDHQVDMLRMSLDVSFEPTQGLVKGTVIHQFVPLRKQVDTLFFDGPGIRIKNAELNGLPLKFTTNDKGIVIYPQKSLTWDKQYEVKFIYEANPRRGIYFIDWNTENGRKQIWTQGQGIDHRNWIPMYDDMDDKFITETRVTFDKQYQVLSNGKKVWEKDNKDGTKTWYYAMTRPHAGYLLMLAIGDYKVKSTKSSRGVPVNFWYYPDKPEWVEPTSMHTEKMMDFLEAETGIPYPWESYSQVMVKDFLYGAMENTTATIFGDFFATDERGFIDRNYMGVNCHEFTHQWFGDYITARSGNDSWLQESWATYFPKVFFHQLYGNDHYEWTKRAEHNSALEAGKKDRLPIRHTGAGTARIYQKGSAVIDMLHDILGDEAFKRMLTHYLRTHAYSNVETNDLYQAIQDKLGITLDWFFDEWIYRGGEPSYQVGWQEITAGGQRKVQVNVDQVHITDEVVGLFKMPIVFEVYYTDGTHDSRREWISSRSQQVMFDAGSRQVSFVLFDPGSTILKTVTYKRSYTELKSIALNAPHMIDRYDALVALRDYPMDDDKRKLMQDIFSKETFHALKAEIMGQLGNNGDQFTRDMISKGLADKAVEVRVAVLNAMKPANASNQEVLLNMLKDSSYNVIALTIEKACQLYPGNAGTFLAASAGIYGQTANVRIKWLENAIRYNYGDMAANKDSLVMLARPGEEFRTRVAAMNSCKALNIWNETLASHMLDAMINPNGRLSGPAAEVMTYYYTNWNNRAMIKSKAEQYGEDKRVWLYKAMPALKD